jgi:hypothetical protein
MVERDPHACPESRTVAEMGTRGGSPAGDRPLPEREVRSQSQHQAASYDLWPVQGPPGLSLGLLAAP